MSPVSMSAEQRGWGAEQSLSAFMYRSQHRSLTYNKQHGYQSPVAHMMGLTFDATPRLPRYQAQP